MVYQKLQELYSCSCQSETSGFKSGEHLKKVELPKNELQNFTKSYEKNYKNLEKSSKKIYKNLQKKIRKKLGKKLQKKLPKINKIIRKKNYKKKIQKIYKKSYESYEHWRGTNTDGGPTLTPPKLCIIIYYYIL